MLNHKRKSIQESSVASSRCYVGINILQRLVDLIYRNN